MVNILIYVMMQTEDSYRFGIYPLSINKLPSFQKSLKSANNTPGIAYKGGIISSFSQCERFNEFFTEVDELGEIDFGKLEKITSEQDELFH